MTPEEERKEGVETLYRAVHIANKFGPLIIEDSDGKGGTAATTAAIMLSTFTCAMGMTLHDAMGLFMAVHKQTMIFERENETDK
jgi:hypothetical protein